RVGAAATQSAMRRRTSRGAVVTSSAHESAACGSRMADDVAAHGHRRSRPCASRCLQQQRSSSRARDLERR
ncbi:hypothetical protein Dimus_035267, partial [Dionaea muscipula]